MWQSCHPIATQNPTPTDQRHPQSLSGVRPDPFPMLFPKKWGRRAQMAIFWKCSCGSLNSLKRARCKCGFALRSLREKRYAVQVRYRGLRKTVVVHDLSSAREAEIKLKAELLQAYHARKDPKNFGITFESFYSEHYKPWAEANLKSFRKCKPLIEKWFLPTFGSRKLKDISSLDMEKLKTEILSAGRAPRTAQHLLALAKAIFNKAIEWGFLSGSNPVKGVKSPRFDNRRVRYLTKEEARMLLEECKKRTTEKNLIYPLVLVALTTGMRAGEIFNLKVQDLNLEEGIIYIRDPKSGTNRVAYMSDEVKEVFRSLIKGKKRSEHVFQKPDGRPFKEVPDVWKGIVKRLGFNEGVTDPREKVVFHTLRHTFCSWLAMKGVPLHVIKELAGHKTLQMTERYSHLMPDIKRTAAEKVWKELL